MPVCKASQYTTKSLIPSSRVSTRALLNLCFRISKDSCCFEPQLNLIFLRVKVVKGMAILEKFSMNLL
ncbi:hypothetical protein HanXRQr2_Chr17g0804771 [Helianthus annuus]|uniref:Uncharacterized protein n=1 Tax=Helianthus annuus TaxID=4232 RepID=A0A251RRG7_HELAN|nr:hypothetical protein HanXRQr2_Chr17g0804771 [Helianthus annuus]KAJ0813465.1 hypothetical protein HanPSC8_Chr17g0773721 [Helianthus annuus]